VVARGNYVWDVRVGGDAGGLLQEADNDVRRRAYRVEYVAGVDHQVHVPLQDGVNSSRVRLLNVNLPLVSPRLGVQLRVPCVPKVRIRDVGYAYYVSAFLSA
jgi:hypothetical protein